jgi:hypothetical protein
MSKRTKILHNVGLAQQPINHNITSTGPQSTFYFDPDSVKQKETAVQWADVIWTYGRPSCRVPKGYWYLIAPPISNGSTGYTPIVRANKPMTGLILTDIDVRMEGGRAYKVINPADNSLFDIREDQMLQAIIKYGIQAGGLIGGEWVWAMNHTQIKCYLVDGKEYLDMLAEHKLPTHPAI